MKEEFATGSSAWRLLVSVTSRSRSSHSGRYLFRGQLMRVYVLSICSLLLAAGGVGAQVPRPADSNRVVDATIGNRVLQVRYLTESPIGPAKSELDYGLLLTEDNDIIASTALMFDTNLDPLPHLRLDIRPPAYLARLVAPQQTDV